MNRILKPELLKLFQQSYFNNSPIPQDAKLEVVNILQEELLQEGFSLTEKGVEKEFVFFKNELGVGL